jgi:hypothetical protein
MTRLAITSPAQARALFKLDDGPQTAEEIGAQNSTMLALLDEGFVCRRQELVWRLSALGRAWVADRR